MSFSIHSQKATIMSATQQANLALLDMSIDDIDDLPGFECPVNGVYTLKFSTSVKVVNDKDAVEASFEVIECNEQNNAADEPTKPGTKFSCLYFLDNEISQGKMKELLLPVAKHFDERNILKLITDTCKDLIVVAKVRRRADKNDKERFYPDVSGIVIA